MNLPAWRYYQQLYHGWVQTVTDWPHSSFHHFVVRGVYSTNWGHEGRFEIQAGE